MQNEKHSFYGYSPERLVNELKDQFDESSFRYQQLYNWVYKQRIVDPDAMTNIAKPLRERMADHFSFDPAPINKRLVSKDGSRKYLFEVDQGHLVESVMIKQPNRMTLCVSSQVGCGFGCAFCQTGTMGYIRHLNASEIIKQVVGVIDDAKNFGDMFTNMVFMGMGEPLHNIDNVVCALKTITDSNGLAFSGRRITVSTVGLVPAIKKFFESGVDVNLAVSLNATTNEVRDEIMPVNRRFPIEVLLETLRSVPLKPRRHITIEYVMLKGVNDTDADLERLPKLIEGLPAKVNLIPYNWNDGFGFDSPLRKNVDYWHKRLLDQGVVTTVRWSKGVDISAACGQLVTQSIKKKRVNNTSENVSSMLSNIIAN